MKTPWVTEHAMFRFLERTGRIDPVRLAAEILTPEVAAACKMGAASIKSQGMTFILDRGKVVTVKPGTAKGSRRMGGMV